LCGDSIPGPLLLARWEKCITQSLDVIYEKEGREKKPKTKKKKMKQNTVLFANQFIRKKERERGEHRRENINNATMHHYKLI
jgi:hypothetical protein